MSEKDRYLIFSLVLTLIFAVLISFVGGSNSANLGGFSVFSWCVIIAFAINWLAFIPANIAQTEHYYDLIGAVTYISIITTAVVFSPSLDTRSLLVALMVIVWALRLGLFLFVRIKRYGKDWRFDEMKTKPLSFLVAWTVQALWTVVTAACALAIITSTTGLPLSWLGIIGILIWLIGFAIEVIADHQKSLFKRNPANKDKFIKQGLWARSQHPNYFGEILLWIGMAIIAIPVLSGWQYFCLISPVFVFCLLRYVSGVPDLQKKAMQNWGDDSDYLDYKKSTPLLIPFFR